MKKQLQKRFAAKRPRSVQTRGHLKVSHRRYTGYVLSHRHTSYPTLIMILLIVGVFMFGCMQISAADTYDVRARVSGPAPTVAATIDSPAEGTVFTDVPIHVTGACPLQTYVNLYRNGVYSGTASCASTDSYDIQTGLFEGPNELKTRVFNFNDDPGPFSSSVTVTYDPPKPPPPPEPAVTQQLPTPTTTITPTPTAGEPSGQAGSSDPVLIKTEFRYHGVYVGEASTIRLTIQGGEAPYALSVDWGDGVQETLLLTRAGVFDINHTYAVAGSNRGAHTIQLEATDARGRTGYLQVFAVVNNAALSTAATASTPRSGLPGVAGTVFDGVIKYLVSTYAVIVLMVVSFWLGELREFKLLQRPHRRHARAH